MNAPVTSAPGMNKQWVERRAKAVSALVRAHRDVSELGAIESAKAPKEDEEELRAELRRRLARYADAVRAGELGGASVQVGTGASAS